LHHPRGSSIFLFVCLVAVCFHAVHVFCRKGCARAGEDVAGSSVSLVGDGVWTFTPRSCSTLLPVVPWLEWSSSPRAGVSRLLHSRPAGSGHQPLWAWCPPGTARLTSVVGFPRTVAPRARKSSTTAGPAALEEDCGEPPSRSGPVTAGGRPPAVRGRAERPSTNVRVNKDVMASTTAWPWHSRRELSELPAGNMRGADGPVRGPGVRESTCLCAALPL
jgi:hypothetical protein